MMVVTNNSIYITVLRRLYMLELKNNEDSLTLEETIKNAYERSKKTSNGKEKPPKHDVPEKEKIK